MLIGSSHNDTFVAGASDVINTGSGNNEVNLKNSESGGATIDQTASNSARTSNNIQGYDPLLNMIRVSAEALSEMTASFVDGQLVTKFGRTTNTFVTSDSSDLAEPASIDESSLWGGNSDSDTLFGGNDDDYIRAEDVGIDEIVNIALGSANDNCTTLEDDQVNLAMQTGNALSFTGGSQLTAERDKKISERK